VLGWAGVAGAVVEESDEALHPNRNRQRTVPTRKGSIFFMAFLLVINVCLW